MLKKILLSISSFLITLVVLLIISEIVLRVTQTEPYHRNALNAFHAPDEHIGWRGKSNFQGTFARDSFVSEIAFNENGYRKKGAKITPNANAEKIVFTGDSFAWGWGVSQGEVFSDYLQDLVGQDLNVMNFGVNTFATVQEKIQLEKEILPLKPKYFSILFYGNDFKDNVDGRNNNRPYCIVNGENVELKNYPIQNPIGSMYRSFTSHSYALTHIRYYHNLLREYLKARKEEAKVKVSPKFQDIKVPSDRVKVFKAYLTLIRNICQKEGIQFFMVYIPTAKNIVKNPNQSMNYREVVKNVCEELKVNLLDLTSVFSEKITGSNGEPYYFTNDLHWTALGHELAAQEISEYLNQKNSIAKSKNMN